MAARFLPQARRVARPPTAIKGMSATPSCYLPRWRNRPHNTNCFRRSYQTLIASCAEDDTKFG